MEPSSITSAARQLRDSLGPCLKGRFVDQTLGRRKPLVVLKDGLDGKMGSPVNKKNGAW